MCLSLETVEQELIERQIWKRSTTHDEMVKYILFELRKPTECLHAARQPAACVSQQALSVIGEQLMVQERRRSFRESQLPKKFSKSSGGLFGIDSNRWTIIASANTPLKKFSAIRPAICIGAHGNPLSSELTTLSPNPSTQHCVLICKFNNERQASLPWNAIDATGSILSCHHHANQSTPINFFIKVKNRGRIHTAPQYKP